MHSYFIFCIKIWLKQYSRTWFDSVYYTHLLCMFWNYRSKYSNFIATKILTLNTLQIIECIFFLLLFKNSDLQLHFLSVCSGYVSRGCGASSVLVFFLIQSCFVTLNSSNKDGWLFLLWEDEKGGGLFILSRSFSEGQRPDSCSSLPFPLLPPSLGLLNLYKSNFFISFVILDILLLIM